MTNLVQEGIEYELTFCLTRLLDDTIKSIKNFKFQVIIVSYDYDYDDT